jgi:heme-degrading monooxygenase HmoA
MYARVTLFELDTVRLPLAGALERFKALVVPALRGQPGYAGAYALSTPEGKGLLLTLWESEAAAQAGEATGFYDEQVAKFLMLMRQPPGRDHYEVIYFDAPATAPA